MRYVAAYLLAVLGGNKNPGSDDIVKILSSVGIEADNEKLSVVIKELSGKNIKDLIEQGRTRLSSMPSGGAAAVSPAVGGAPVAGGKGPVKEEKKEEPKKVEAEPESDDDDAGFGGLFD